MVKKIGVFITILGLFFVGIPQFNSKALIYNGVDYRILETGTPVQINDNEYNPITINEENGGVTVSNWLYYMQANNIYRVVMQASNVSTIYFYYGTTLVQIEHSVFKIVINYDDGLAFYYMRFYGLNELQIGDEIILAYSENNWEVPSNTRILTNIMFQSNENIYSQGYNDGYDVGYNVGNDEGYDGGYDKGYTHGEDYGYNNGYNIGYNVGLNETDATGFVGLLTAVFSGVSSLLSVELLPGIYIGAVMAVPLVFGIIYFILGKRKE